MPKGQIAINTNTGTGSAQNIALGFLPDFILMANVTDGDEVYVWWNGMAAATHILISTAAATAGSNGITQYAGTAAGNAAGFTAGTAVSESAKVYRYIAVGAQ
jgi:hypothetical protein